MKRAGKASKPGRKGAKKSTSKSAASRGLQGSRRAPKKVEQRTSRSNTLTTGSRGKRRGRMGDRKSSTSASPKGLKVGGEPSRAEALRAMLEAKRGEVLEEIRRARKDGLETDRTSFAEVGDLVSASVEKERAFEYGEIGVNALREIDTALEKLKAGTYGICDVCGKNIGLKRLKVVPSARLCIKCKSSEEASGSGGRGRSDT